MFGIKIRRAIPIVSSPAESSIQMWRLFTSLVPADLGNTNRTRAAKALQDPYYHGISDGSVPELILAQIRAIVDLKIAGVRSLETKASQIAGFSGTIVAIASATGHIFDTGIARFALLLLIATIACCLFAMQLQSNELPSPALYNSDLVARDPSNKAKIAMALAEAYIEYSADLQRQNGIKARFANGGFVLFLIALILLAVSIGSFSLPKTDSCKAGVRTKSTNISHHVGRAKPGFRACNTSCSANTKSGRGTNCSATP